MNNNQLKKYVDIEAAQNRLGGNRKLLDTLLKKFAKETYLDQLKNQIMTNDFESAVKTAHTIKGVAANLSLTTLYALIVALEIQLKNGAYEEKTLAETEDVYASTISSINQL